MWINAADIYNRTAFVFGSLTAFAFDVPLYPDSYPIAEAVAASAAVPVIFAPVVIRTYPEQMPRHAVAGLDRDVRTTIPNTPPMLKRSRMPWAATTMGR